MADERVQIEIEVHAQSAQQEIDRLDNEIRKVGTSALTTEQKVDRIFRLRKKRAEAVHDLKLLQGELGNTAMKANHAAGATRNLGTQMAYLASDAGFLLQNPRIGLMAIGNNISQVAIAATHASKKVGGLAKALGTALKVSLPMIALQLFISVMTQWDFIMGLINKKTKEQAELNKELGGSYLTLADKIKENNKALAETEKKAQDLYDWLVRDLGVLEDRKWYDFWRPDGLLNMSIKAYIENLRELGIEVDEARLKDKKYLKQLGEKVKLTRNAAKELVEEQKDIALTAYTDTRLKREAAARVKYLMKVYDLSEEEALERYKDSPEGKRNAKRQLIEKYKLQEKFIKADAEIAAQISSQAEAEEELRQMAQKEAREKMFADFEKNPNEWKIVPTDEIEVMNEEDLELFDEAGARKEEIRKKWLRSDEEIIKDKQQEEINTLLSFFTFEEIKTGEHLEALKKLKDKHAEEDKQRDQKVNDAKSQQLQHGLNAIGNFLHKSAQLDKKNKDLARAAIITNAAAASIGIWRDYHGEKNTIPTPFNSILAGVQQLALVASTAAALKSLNSNTPIGGGGGGGSRGPNFNIIGATGNSQLQQTVDQRLSEQQDQKVVLVESELETRKSDRQVSLQEIELG